jgi:U4/U6.U5 tri-snRNP-associated protein 3
MLRDSLVLRTQRDLRGVTDSSAGMNNSREQARGGMERIKGKRERHHEREPSDSSDLPTRLKAEEKPSSASPAPMSFRVGSGGGHDRDGDGNPDSRARGRGRERSFEDGERAQGDGDELMDDGEDGEEDDVVVADDGMDAMAAMMGFSGFDSTKGKKIAGNNVGAVRKEKKTEYRQYMNRTGGFNRPLSPSR